MHDLARVGDALLEQVRPPFRAPLEQRERVGRIRVLAQDDDADRRTGVPEREGGPHAFVGPRRRHPDVGDDDVGRFPGRRLHELVVGPAGPDDLDAFLVVEQFLDALADEEVVVRDHHTQRHRRKT